MTRTSSAFTPPGGLLQKARDARYVGAVALQRRGRAAAPVSWERGRVRTLQHACLGNSTLARQSPMSRVRSALGENVMQRGTLRQCALVMCSMPDTRNSGLHRSACGIGNTGLQVCMRSTLGCTVTACQAESAVCQA